MRSLVLSVLFLLSSLTAKAQVAGGQFAKIGPFQLEKGNLKAVQRVLGHSRVIETGEAGDYEAVIHYQAKGGFVSFYSNEMGGLENQLLGFSVRKSLKTPIHGKVPKLKRQFSLNVAGIHLGMTRSEFERVLAVTVEWHGNEGHVYFSTKVPMSETEIQKSEMAQDELKRTGGPLFYDASVSVTGTFDQDHLQGFQIWKVTTF